jgi:hypothetical protein
MMMHIPFDSCRVGRATGNTTSIESLQSFSINEAVGSIEYLKCETSLVRTFDGFMHIYAQITIPQRYRYQTTGILSDAAHYRIL